MAIIKNVRGGSVDPQRPLQTTGLWGRLETLYLATELTGLFLKLHIEAWTGTLTGPQAIKRRPCN